MPYYYLERVSDQVQFSRPATDDAEALFFFSKEVGCELTFEGDGPSPYLFQRTMTSIGWVKPDIPVYCAG